MNPVKVVTVVLSTVVALSADGFIIFPPPHVTPLSVKYHNVTCTIDNGVATTVVDQEFVNNQDFTVSEGRYVFPVPRDAAIDGFSMVVDGEEKNTTVMDREEARAFFTTAVKNSNQATLLEYTDNSAYSLEIGSLEPGASKRVQLSYSEVLLKSDGLSNYLYPLNTERYSMQLIDSVSITVNITNTTPITSVYSPSFPVTIERTDEKNVSVSYTGTKVRPDRDFDLYYKLSDEDISFHLFTCKKENEDGYFLMLITPKFQRPDEAGPLMAKDIVFTIDQSGSMSGTKIEQARDGLRFCINRLLPEDYFNIVAFETTVSSNADELLPATAENIGAVAGFVDQIVANGNTNISGALTTSLSRMGETDRPHYCIFLTDGMATAGETNSALICETVNEANTSGTRIFSIGFGFSVNTILLDKLSIDNSGYPLYCSPDQSVEEVISDLYRKIESPVLTSPEVSFSGEVTLHSVTPERLPDLFTGSEIAIYGRYSGQGTTAVALTGNIGAALESFSYTADFPLVDSSSPFLPRLWATQQIAALMMEIKLLGLTQESTQALEDSLKALSLTYGIVTPYTSSLFIPGGAGISISENLQIAQGAGANDASNYMQGMQQNSNAEQTMVTDTNALPPSVAPQVNQMQNVGNKLFVFSTDSLWKDAMYDSSATADTVYYGSEEYFALADQNAELKKILTVGNQAAFNYGGKNYIVLDNGTSGVSPRYGARRAKTVSGMNFSVVRKGGTVSFVRTSNAPGGIVAIFSINGRCAACLSFGTSNSTSWTLSGTGGAAGTYLAVYREGGIERVKRFLLE
ncbi:MAG: VWA domain-containing protein [Chitinispirillaceae bacterium]|nr:VWA domain-containing protein [Chitinispirillaceae bacterium]